MNFREIDVHSYKQTNSGVPAELVYIIGFWDKENKLALPQPQTNFFEKAVSTAVGHCCGIAFHGDKLSTFKCPPCAPTQ